MLYTYILFYYAPRKRDAETFLFQSPQELTFSMEVKRKLRQYFELGDGDLELVRYPNELPIINF